MLPWYVTNAVLACAVHIVHNSIALDQLISAVTSSVWSGQCHMSRASLLPSHSGVSFCHRSRPWESPVPLSRSSSLSNRYYWDSRTLHYKTLDSGISSSWGSLQGPLSSTPVAARLVYIILLVTDIIQRNLEYLVSVQWWTSSISTSVVLGVGLKSEYAEAQSSGSLILHIR